MALRNFPSLQQHHIHDVHLTGHYLAIGSFKNVLEARIPDGFCAVKTVRNFFGKSEKDVDEALWKFFRECELMSGMRNPHILQFLGVCEFPGSPVPALVTELMLTDLGSMLLRYCCSSKLIIPREIKHSILRDVARGLVFLHSQSPPIIHRDLYEPSKILLNSAMVAKIAGFSEACRVFKVVSPNNWFESIFPSPFSFVDHFHNESMDIFMFGFLCIITLTQTIPKPLPAIHGVIGDAKMIDCFISQDKKRIYFEQSNSVISWLTTTIQQCLSSEPDLRPTAQQVLSVLESEWTEEVERQAEMSKPELVQTIEIQKKVNTITQQL